MKGRDVESVESGGTCLGMLERSLISERSVRRLEMWMPNGQKVREQEERRRRKQEKSGGGKRLRTVIWGVAKV